MAFYGSVSDVKRLTGIRPGDLMFEGEGETTADEQLDSWLEERLTEISALINIDRNRSDWEEQGWLPAINGIANRWCAEHIRFAMAHRGSPIIRVDEFQVQAPTDNVPGKGVLNDLRRFPRKTGRGVMSLNVNEVDW